MADDHARTKIRKQRLKTGRQVDLRALRAAGFTFVVTNVDAAISMRFETDRATDYGCNTPAADTKEPTLATSHGG